MLVIGNRDLEPNAVSVHGKGNLGAKSRNQVAADIRSTGNLDYHIEVA